MVYAASLTKSGVIGDLRYELWTLTDVQNDSSSTVTTQMKNPLMATAICEKVASDQFNVVSISAQTITLDASTTDDDGKLFVIGY